MQWSWQQVAFALGAVGLIILAHRYAPESVQVITGIVTTLTGLVLRSPVVNPPPKVQP